jgi:hypothetical protein
MHSCHGHWGCCVRNTLCWIPCVLQVCAQLQCAVLQQAACLSVVTVPRTPCAGPMCPAGACALSWCASSQPASQLARGVVGSRSVRSKRSSAVSEAVLQWQKVQTLLAALLLVRIHQSPVQQAVCAVGMRSQPVGQMLGWPDVDPLAS